MSSLPSPVSSTKKEKGITIKDIIDISTFSNYHEISPSEDQFKLIKQGAEGRVYVVTYHNRETIVKERFPKKYRLEELDKKIIGERFNWEVKNILKCRKLNILTPDIYYIDSIKNRIFMEYIDGITLKDYLYKIHDKAEDKNNVDYSSAYPLFTLLGGKLSTMHNGSIIHGDLTTSNILVTINKETNIEELTFIDFGLSYHAHTLEDKAVDLYVLERALSSTHPHSELLFENMLTTYLSNNSKGVMKQLDKVRARGRKRTMIG